jgi:allantoinase
VDNELYDYWPITDRQPLELPGGAKLAFYIGLNIEHFQYGKQATSMHPATAANTPDPFNHGWRDYGTRVGVWRMMKLLDECGLRASVLLNTDVGSQYPEIIQAGNDRGWSWVGHGKTNSEFWVGMTPQEEAVALAELTDTFRRVTGQQPKGWLGPALTETAATPNLLAENGFTYLLDWPCDEQPFPLNVPGHRMISVPYTVELNDIPKFLGEGVSGEAFGRMIVDQFDQMREEGTGGVMSLALHPFIINHPYRHKYLAEALRYIAAQDDVWLTTSDDIADWYLENHYDQAVERLATRKHAATTGADRRGPEARLA